MQEPDNVFGFQNGISVRLCSHFPFSNVLGIPRFPAPFPRFLLLLKVPKKTPNLREIEGKGKVS